MPTGKAIGAIVLKFLSGTNLTLKVDRFNGFVNRISKADFMITKTSRCKKFFKRGAYINMVEISHLYKYILEMCDIHEYEYYRDINDGDIKFSYIMS